MTIVLCFDVQKYIKNHNLSFFSPHNAYINKNYYLCSWENM